MVTTHPIQYQVPWLRMLSMRNGVDLTVYFAMVPDAAEQGREFGVAFAWDVPLVEGYKFQVLRNQASQPSLTAFSGCDTPGIIGEIRKGGYDAVIVNGWVAKTCVQALIGCRLSGTPCLVRGEANGLRPRSAWMRGAHRLLLTQYAAALGIGGRNREYYEARGVPPARIFDTPYCVDNDRFSASAAQWLTRETRDGLRRRFGLQPDRTTFIFSGKFSEKKRPFDLLEALRRCDASGLAAQVLLVGGGPLESQLRQQAEGLPVVFAGFLNQTEIAAAYAASDCLVLPSDAGETWGLVVNEAMACGLPALVSDEVGCAFDLVQEGKTGAIFRCGDIDGLADRLRELARQPEKCAEMGSRARDLVNRDYHFGKVVDGVLAAVAAVGRSR